MMAKYYNLDYEQALHWPLDTFLVMMKQPPDGLKSLVQPEGFPLLLGYNVKIPKIEMRVYGISLKQRQIRDPKYVPRNCEMDIYVNNTNVGRFTELREILDRDLPPYVYSCTPPYAVGDKVGFRETWGEEWEFDKEHGCFVLTGSYIYKSDNPATPRGGWHSPATMPSEAIRKWCKVVSVECKHVQEMTDVEMSELIHRPVASELKELMGSGYSIFINWFNAHYAKPKAIRKHGKIMGYKCRVYDSVMDIKPTYLTIDTDGKWQWKRLPLEIITKPFIQLVKTEEIEKP